MLFNASLFREDDGTIGGVVAVGRDVTRHYEDRIQAKQRSITGGPLRSGRCWASHWAGFCCWRARSCRGSIHGPRRGSLARSQCCDSPYLHAGDHQPTPTFHAGRVAFAHVSTQRGVACFALIQQRILSLIDDQLANRIVWSNLPISSGYTQAGDFEIDYRFVVPDDLPQGDYFLERNTTYHCGRTTIDQNQPLILVRRGEIAWSN